MSHLNAMTDTLVRTGAPNPKATRNSILRRTNRKVRPARMSADERGDEGTVFTNLNACR